MNALRKRFDVSINTIGQALNILAVEGVVESWQGSGVYVAERTKKPRIGIVCELDVMNPSTFGFHHHMMWHLRTFFREHDVLSHLYIGETQPAGGQLSSFTCWPLVDDLAARRLEGVIALQSDWTRSWVPAVEEQGLPLIGLVSDYPHGVYTDVGKMIRDGVQQLARQGCRRLAFLGWGTDVFITAFTAGLKEWALPVREGWMRHNLQPNLNGAGWEEFREIWAAYPEKPDGLIVADDILSVSAAGAIREMGIRVPDQLKLVVAGNRGSGIRYPFPVTVLELDPSEIAQHLGTMMLRLLRRETVAEPHVLVPYRMVQEQSGQPSPQIQPSQINGGER